MADDPNPALRAELLAALTVLAPQIRGLHSLSAVSPPDLRVEVNAQIAARERRRDLIQAVLNGLDMVVAERTALEADGYPALPPDAVIASLFAELNEEMSDLQSAAAVFKLDQAANMSVALGKAADKS